MGCFCFTIVVDYAAHGFVRCWWCCVPRRWDVRVLLAARNDDGRVMLVDGIGDESGDEWLREMWDIRLSGCYTVYNVHDVVTKTPHRRPLSITTLRSQQHNKTHASAILSWQHYQPTQRYNTIATNLTVAVVAYHRDHCLRVPSHIP